MDRDKETGQQLRINKEIAEEPTLVNRGNRYHHLPQVIRVALVAPDQLVFSTQCGGLVRGILVISLDIDQ